MISTHIASQLAIVINLLSTLYVYIAIDRRIAMAMYTHWKCSLAASARYVQLRSLYIARCDSYLLYLVAIAYICCFELHAVLQLQSQLSACAYLYVAVNGSYCRVHVRCYVQSGGTLAPCALLILTLCPCCHLLFNQDQSIYNIIIMKKFTVCPHSCRYAYNYNISGIHFTHASTRMHTYTGSSYLRSYIILSTHACIVKDMYRPIHGVI